MAQTGTARSETPPAAAEPRQRSVRVVMAGLLLAMLLAMLDNMIVGTAMPTIVGELGGLNHLSWVVTAYTLATAASTPIWGKLGDMYGRKGVFLTSIVLFLAGSALSGMSRSMDQLITFRAVQGLGAGGLMVGVMAIIGELIPPRERGKYQGMIAGVMAVAMIGGPLVGGTITDNWGWRWSFYINLPIGAVALAVITVVLHLPKKKPDGATRIDYYGAGLLTVAITSLVLLTTWGGTQYAWGSVQIIGLLLLGLAALAGFVLVETRVAEPVLPLRIFRSRNFSLISVVGFLVGFTMFGAITFLPLYQQSVQGASATNSGLLLLPMLLAMMIVSMVAGRLTTSTGRYKVFPIVGGVLITIGLFLLSMMDVHTSRTTSGLYMAVLGAGMGFIMQITMLVAQNSVEMRDIGVGSSSATLFRTIGGSFGVSLFGALFSHRVQHEMAARLGAKGSAAIGTGAQLDPKTIAHLPAPVKDAYFHAVAAGTHQVFLWGAAVSILGFLAALFVIETPLRGATPEPEDATPLPESI
ncbi:drug resistance transporter, EmrB/QacA subfamily [Actinacidiphila yanglinensis]|uniref:Drug resistance transporter, EmrB/QacA subfamily n=1 Tax=Actinacidiphila yanglinensis TaxID=310779 RepID=A0A1H6DSS4_9ACTN|nr:MDR family MFS transporter [Actinacidiphila yanglinensis]SEG88270.1 drug resistance transporter, EmrB/QacA subfamily [Actinacidiphila yanglinensis]